MQMLDLEYYYAWFAEYTTRFTSDNPLTKINLDLKNVHTQRVAKKCRTIAEALQLPDEQCLLAEILGLFHDLGRFPQFTQFGTFRDYLSRNHADWSMEVLEAEEIWRQFSPSEQHLLSTAIVNHNRYAIPADCTGDALLFSKLIRDADKLDNLSMTADGSNQRYTITLNAQGDGDVSASSDAETISPAVLDAIRYHRCVRYDELETELDKAFTMISLVFDIYFESSLREIRDNHYIERIFARIPQQPSLLSLQDTVLTFIEQQLVLMMHDSRSA